MPSYYDWKASALTCERCSWQGRGRDAAMRESFNEGAEHERPQCAADFGFHAWPTVSEVRSDPRADPIDKALLEKEQGK